MVPKGANAFCKASGEMTAPSLEGGEHFIATTRFLEHPLAKRIFAKMV